MSIYCISTLLSSRINMTEELFTIQLTLEIYTFWYIMKTTMFNSRIRFIIAITKYWKHGKHLVKSIKMYCRTNRRKYSFPQRVVAHWNALPGSVIDATSVKRCCISLISRVALLWTFSIIIASFLFATDQTVLPYSKCGLTRLLNSCRNMSLSMYLNDLLIPKCLQQ
jgi:hypothetical protein